MLPPGSTWLSIASTALEEGLAYLNERFGENTSNWTWGLVHQTRPQHTLSGAFPSLAAVLDPPSFPLGGDGDTPLSGGYSPTDPFTITGTSAARYVFDLGDWNDSVWTVPLGSSGHPGSPHYADQAQTWRKIELTPMLYDWDLIASSAESRQKLGDN
jgi:penicillin amidase